jgi:hypothetical protein
MQAIRPALSRLPVIAVVLAITVSAGCAAVLASLPAIVTATTEAVKLIDQIEEFVTDQHGMTGDIALAIKVARNAVDAVRDVANTATSIHDKDFQAALDNARAAFDRLYAVTKALGVHPRPGNGLLAAPDVGGLGVPPAIEVRQSLEGGS